MKKIVLLSAAAVAGYVVYKKYAARKTTTSPAPVLTSYNTYAGSQQSEFLAAQEF